MWKADVLGAGKVDELDITNAVNCRLYCRIEHWLGCLLPVHVQRLGQSTQCSHWCYRHWLYRQKFYCHETRVDNGNEFEVVFIHDHTKKKRGCRMLPRNIITNWHWLSMLRHCSVDCGWFQGGPGLASAFLPCRPCSLRLKYRRACQYFLQVNDMQTWSRPLLKVSATALIMFAYRWLAETIL